jgi:TPR repeat protein
MVDQTPRYQPYNLDIDIHDKTLTDRRVAPYKFELSVRTDSHAEDPVPAFLSDYDSEPDPSEYVTPLRKGSRRSVSARILAGVLVTAAAAILFAMFSSDATRDIVVNAKVSIAASLPAYAALQPDPAQLTAHDTQLKKPNDAARLSAPANQTPGVRAVATAAVEPTREEITAYQSAMPDGRASAATSLAARPPDAPVAAAPPAPAPVAALPPAPVPQLIPGDAIQPLDPNELASSLRRADDLIASGDLAAARLVLRRAANAGDARAAMTLAGTYDPAILDKLGVHGLVPDVAMARVWYEKAKKFGSAEAPQRLELLASKRQ